MAAEARPSLHLSKCQIVGNHMPQLKYNCSRNGKQAFFGMQDGTIRVQNLLLTRDLSELGPYWCLNVHDNIYGHLTGIIQSFDESTLISTGADGNFFQFAIMGQEQLEKKIAENKAKIPSAKVQYKLNYSKNLS